MTEDIGGQSIDQKDASGEEVFLSPREGAQILWMSYRFSQGSPVLQEILLTKVATDNGQFKVDQQAQSEMLQEAKEMIVKTVTSGKYHSVQGLHAVEESIESEFGQMLRIFNGDKMQVAADKDILSYIISRDHKLLTERRGRPKLEPGEGQLGDLWGSQAVTFVLEGKPTGHPAFDKIFSDLRSLFESEDLSEVNEDSIDKLTSVIQIYNEHHPENPYHDPNLLDTLEKAKGKIHEKI